MFETLAEIGFAIALILPGFLVVQLSERRRPSTPAGGGLVLCGGANRGRPLDGHMAARRRVGWGAPLVALRSWRPGCPSSMGLHIQSAQWELAASSAPESWRRWSTRDPRQIRQAILGCPES